MDIFNLRLLQWRYNVWIVLIFPTISQTSNHLPLMFCINSGGHDAEYFDINEDSSILTPQYPQKHPLSS